MSTMKTGDSVHLDIVGGAKEDTNKHTANGVNSTQNTGHNSSSFWG